MSVARLLPRLIDSGMTCCALPTAQAPMMAIITPHMLSNDDNENTGHQRFRVASYSASKYECMSLVIM